MKGLLRFVSVGFLWAMVLGLAVSAEPGAPPPKTPPPNVVVLAVGVNGVPVTYLEEYEVVKGVTGLRLRVCAYVDLPAPPGPNGWYKATWYLEGDDCGAPGSNNGTTLITENWGQAGRYLIEGTVEVGWWNDDLNCVQWWFPNDFYTLTVMVRAVVPGIYDETSSCDWTFTYYDPGE